MADDLSLERFVEVQEPVYATALAEIRCGAKRSHWMWFPFPQLGGLGRSETARVFGVRSLPEARAYLDRPVLGRRYIECVGALQDLGISDPVAVFGAVDVMKLRSSLTLFEAAWPMPLFAAALDRWFAGNRDSDTLLES
jgi:uncharacterized protein (DUF1810 family)